jgi:hypothetical protein
LVVGAAPHRVLEPGEPTAEIHLAVGPDLDVWRAKPEAQEVAFVEPRTAAERATYRQLRDRIVDDLLQAGLPELVDAVDVNPVPLLFDPRLPDPTYERLDRLLDLDLPLAVFIAPADAGR